MAVAVCGDDLSEVGSSNLRVAPEVGSSILCRRRACAQCLGQEYEYAREAKWVRRCPLCHRPDFVCDQCKQNPCLDRRCESRNLPANWRRNCFNGYPELEYFYNTEDPSSWQWEQPIQQVDYDFQTLSEYSISEFTSEDNSGNDRREETQTADWEPEPERCESELAVFLDINELLDFRPFHGRTVEGAQTDHDELPQGRTQNRITIYYRPGLTSLFQELIVHNNWGFCTTIHRPNAINHLKKLFAKALGACIESNPDELEKLFLVIPSDLGDRRIPFWLFDASHCHATVENPQPFNISPICDKTGLQKHTIVLATAVARKCRGVEESEHLLLCPAYKEMQVCEPNELGLDSLRYTLRYLRALPIHEMLPRLAELNHKTLEPLMPLPRAAHANDSFVLASFPFRGSMHNFGFVALILPILPAIALLFYERLCHIRWHWFKLARP